MVMNKKTIEIIKVFFKLGSISFGGPAAHTAIMEEEIVKKRRWVSREDFLDMMGVTNLIPGPNSTELAIHIGYTYDGVRGLLAAGLAFVLPAVVITTLIAWFYSIYGVLPEAEKYLYGINPAIIVIIFNAVYTMGKKSIKNIKLLIIGLIVFAGSIAGFNEIALLLFAGIAGGGFLFFTSKRAVNSFIFPLGYFIPALLNGLSTSEDKLLGLFLSFLKIGATLFGGGFLLFSYMEGEFVKQLHWLTEKQLMDAIAAGQFTPGPVLSAATFTGFQIAGVWGAVVSTIGVFLPSFLLILLVGPYVKKLRSSEYFSKFLDSVNAASIALMASVMVKLSIIVFAGYKTVLIGMVCFAVFYGLKKVNAVYLIIGGAIAGYILSYI